MFDSVQGGLDPHMTPGRSPARTPGPMSPSQQYSPVHTPWRTADPNLSFSPGPAGMAMSPDRPGYSPTSPGYRCACMHA
jgi:DNA-directed RNA polymerase II subunit RPB1